MIQSYDSQTTDKSFYLKLQCPHCLHLFKSLATDFKEDCPQFQCSMCQGDFWINSHKKDSVILGQYHPIEKTLIPSVQSTMGGDMKVCPRCSETTSKTTSWCSYCGFAFLNIIEGYEASFHLRGLWGKVLRYWHDETIHDRFLQTCHKEKELVYGISCYGRVLKEDSVNRKAKEMIKRMEGLTWFFEETQQSEKNTYKDLLQKIKKSFKSYTFDAFMLTIFICVCAFIFF